MKRLALALLASMLCVASASAQVIAPGTNAVPSGCAYYSSGAPTPVSGQGYWLQCDSSGNLKVTGGGGGGGGLSVVDQTAFTQGTSAFTPGGGVFNDTATLTSGQEGTFRMTTKRAQIVDVDSTGNQLHTDMTAPLPLKAGTIPTTQTPVSTGTTTAAQSDLNGNLYVSPTSQYPAGAVPYSASVTGTTGATTATLTGAASLTTYVCGYSIRANATAVTTVTNTLTGVISGTLSSIMWVPANTAGLGIDEQIFIPCLPASAQNTSIAAVSGAPGTGGVVSSKIWGYKIP